MASKNQVLRTEPTAPATAAPTPYQVRFDSLYLAVSAQRFQSKDDIVALAGTFYEFLNGGA